jgi:hypothetical protein
MVKDVRECEMVRDRRVLPNDNNNGLAPPSDHGVETPTLPCPKLVEESAASVPALRQTHT